jgi:NAD(P)-dependent dehydrogenase (short-subunit alcohol dehydrogenase family)
MTSDAAAPASRSVIVTGAATGVGRALVEQLVADGHRVVAVDIRPDGLAWADGTPGIATVQADISTLAGNEAAVAMALERFGRLDGVALNAALMGLRDSVLDQSLDDVQRMLDVNYFGPLLGIRAAVPALTPGTGSIVITTAAVAERGDPRIWSYAASKAALTSLVRSAAVELGPQGLRVNAVVPGPIEQTGQTAGAGHRGAYVDHIAASLPAQRWGRAGEVAAVAAFLLSPGSSFMHGSFVATDGGAQLALPWYRPGAGPYLESIPT